MLDDELFHKTLIEPALQGADRLDIISGYASSHLAREHLEALNKQKRSVDICLTIGMARQGIELPQHESFKEMHNPPKFSCGYWKGPSLIHAKVYAWSKQGSPVVAYAGSANYTRNGFRQRQVEVLTETDPAQAWEWCAQYADKAHPCINEVGLDRILVFPRRKSPSYVKRDEADSFEEQEEGSQPNEWLDERLPAVELLLYMKKTGEVQARSGLNWGQRKNRNPDQAYIPVPSNVSQSGFFPPRKKPFTVLADDGFKMECVIAQDGDKGLETRKDNSILGKYFRERLGLPSGEFITRKHLDNYGRASVEFKKCGEDKYLMNFSPRK